MTQPNQNSEDGFTLLEALIAFVILSTSLVLMYQIFTDGFRARTRTDIVSICTEYAEQLRNRMQIETKAAGAFQQQTGEFEDGYKWAVLLRGPQFEKEGRVLIGYDVIVTSPSQSGSVTLSSFVNLSINDPNT